MPCPNPRDRWASAEVHPVRVREAGGIAVRRREAEHHRLPPPGITTSSSRASPIVHGEKHLDRVVVADEVLDGAADQRRVGAQGGQLVRVVQQREHAAADQVHRGLVAPPAAAAGSS
jgi:hypothetical protein